MKNTYTITITEEKNGPTTQWHTETKGKLTDTMRAHLLEHIMEKMILQKQRMNVLPVMRSLFEWFN